MTIFFGLLVTIFALVALAWLFAQAKTEKAAQSLRIVLGILGVLLGIALTLRGVAIAGVPLLTAALGLLGVALGGGKRQSGDPTPTSGGKLQGGDPTATTPKTTMSRKDAAALLGVAEDASEEDVRQAYRDLMKRVHPDTGGNDALAAKVKEARDTMLGE